MARPSSGGTASTISPRPLAPPAGQRAAFELLEDERRFIDLEHSPLWIGEEFAVVD
jgi:hypothetical protein